MAHTWFGLVSTLAFKPKKPKHQLLFFGHKLMVFQQMLKKTTFLNSLKKIDVFSYPNGVLKSFRYFGMLQNVTPIFHEFQKP